LAELAKSFSDRHYFELEILEKPMRDDFPHGVVVALGIALAFCVSLFVLAAMGGWL
jgi:hypothetical protein